ncbi:MAG: hypothetical protein F4010_06445 [Cenarchaeum sp. SB0669_bin_11]|nr:hypothetical protein [Cenarchaeum sp. SB0669_bin_11]
MVDIYFKYKSPVQVILGVIYESCITASSTMLHYALLIDATHEFTGTTLAHHIIHVPLVVYTMCGHALDAKMLNAVNIRAPHIVSLFSVSPV